MKLKFERWFFPLSLAFILSSCGWKEKLIVVLDSYRGYDEINLIQNFGKPSKSYLTNGAKVLEFEFVEHHLNVSNGASLFNDGLSINSTPNSQSLGVKVGDIRASYVINQCNLSFTVDQRNLVKDWDYRGNSCKRYATRNNVNKQYVLDLPKIQEKTYAFNLKKKPKGFVIVDLSPLSSAYQLGLREKDVLVKMNDLDLSNTPIEIPYDQMVKSSMLKLVVLRAKERFEFTVPKTEIARMFLYKKSIRRFLGFS